MVGFLIFLITKFRLPQACPWISSLLTLEITASVSALNTIYLLMLPNLFLQPCPLPLSSRRGVITWMFIKHSKLTCPELSSQSLFNHLPKTCFFHSLHLPSSQQAYTSNWSEQNWSAILDGSPSITLHVWFHYQVLYSLFSLYKQNSTTFDYLYLLLFWAELPSLFNRIT